jgi:bifunctional enzyme CysN/CysC
VSPADQFEAWIAWTADEPLLPGRQYLLEVAGTKVVATVAPLKYVVDPASGEHLAGSKLRRGEAGVVELELEAPIVVDDQRFLVLDRMTSSPLGEGRIHFALRRSENVHWQAVDIDKTTRAAQKNQRPCVVWLTGLSGAGKSTIANLLERRLYTAGCHTYLLDGDNVRHGLNRDLGFTPADRVENIRRVGEVARLMVDAGLIVIASFISPYRNERRTVRELLADGEFFEVFVDVPLDVAERRDPKGLYAKARRGELANFTGIGAPYEAPERPELRLDTAASSPEESVEQLIDALASAGVIRAAGQS